MTKKQGKPKAIQMAAAWRKVGLPSFGQINEVCKRWGEMAGSNKKTITLRVCVVHGCAHACAWALVFAWRCAQQGTIVSLHC